jgi:Zinc carboxypeptidase
VKLNRKIVVAMTGVALLSGMLVSPAAASPVCTDGYMGGPPLSVCGNRIFPEAAVARSYVQYLPDPAGFAEYQHGIEYLAELYPRWISVFTFSDHFRDGRAKTAGEDQVRPYENGDSEDGHEIFVIKITDHKVPDKGKETLFFSLSVHGNERGGLEGGLRTAEDLAMAAENGGTITDGLDNYESTTGTAPKFHEYEVSDLLKKEAVYLTSFNIDGWQVGDNYHQPPLPYSRGNALGTDLNRQMPTVGRINESRNPLQESEMKYGHRLMHEIAADGINNKMAYGADVHGELTSNAYVDIMYPAGQFDSVDHRRLMAIAERTKSVIDETLFAGIVNQIEEGSGGNSSSPDEDVPTKPAHWATVWDTLGYTDSGFIGDYLATDLGVTGMDYEIFLNHSVPDKAWNVYLQENHINATRAIIKTAMAYALFQAKEFNGRNVNLPTGGRVGYVLNGRPVTDTDKNGPGTLPGPGAKGIGDDGKKIRQRHYSATNMKWFKDTSKLLERPFVPVPPREVARNRSALNGLDVFVAPDMIRPLDARGRSAAAKPYFKNLKSWVNRGGTLVLTDRALEGLAKLGVVPKSAVQNINVYQPYADILDFEHPMVARLRPNARQLVETIPLGYCIGNECSPMTVVDQVAFEEAGGHTVGTTGDGLASIGEIPLGKGVIRIIGGALPMPTEKHDHRYGLRDYAMTYTGLYIMENSIRVPGKQGSRDAEEEQLSAFELMLLTAQVALSEDAAQPAI